MSRPASALKPKSALLNYIVNSVRFQIFECLDRVLRNTGCVRSIEAAGHPVGTGSGVELERFQRACPAQHGRAIRGDGHRLPRSARMLRRRVGYPCGSGILPKHLMGQAGKKIGGIAAA